VQILMKALMRLPETDFMLCLYLLPVAVQKDAQVEALKSLWDKLETCQFKVPRVCGCTRLFLPLSQTRPVSSPFF